MKKTLVIGASENPDRYAYKATVMLHEYGHPTVLLGNKTGEILGQKIRTEFPENEPVDTVTLYIGPRLQPQYYDAIVKLQPKRIIFNPGTENEELAALAEQHGIEPVEGCTLVMLRSNSF